jgi:hypothetical protein
MPPSLVLFLALRATSASPSEQLMTTAIAYAGSWQPDDEETAKLKLAEKSCGSMFSRKGKPTGRIANVAAARCRLPGLDQSTVAAFNAQTQGGSVWNLSAAPNSWAADLHGSGQEMVSFEAPAFDKDGRQALVLIMVTRRPQVWGHPEAMESFEMLLLAEKDGAGTWAVSHHAVVKAELQ